MTVQDDERERELVRLFNLDWDPAHQRSGVDAVLRLDVDGRVEVLEVEVKSTTGGSVSTARDVGMEHILKWRTKLFVIGFYSREARRPELQRCLCLTPADMKPWIDAVEAKVALDHQLATCAAATLGLDDMYALLGRKSSYTLADAKLVLRQQWTNDEYEAALDTADASGAPALSARSMLTVLQARALYIARRGATLNNPHITSRHLSSFAGTDREVRRDWAAHLRRVALAWSGLSPERSV